MAEFPVHFVGDEHTCYAESVHFTISWASDVGGYAGFHGRYFWEDPEGGVSSFGSADFSSQVIDDVELDNDDLHVTVAGGDGFDSADLWISPDGTVSGTMIGQHFVGWNAEPTTTEVAVSGPIELGCHNIGGPPELELSDGSVAVFDCSERNVTFTIRPAE